MLRGTAKQLLIKSKNITQIMSQASFSQKLLFNNNRLALEIKTYDTTLLEKNLCSEELNFQGYRKFSRTSSLQHDIKCVTTSYYEDLGILSTASSKEIKEAFYKLSKECHPDKVGADNVEALLQFQAISEAYSILSDPKLRRQYDRGTLGKMSSAADRDATKHTFEGDAFIQGRAAFKEEYGSGKKISNRQNLDRFVIHARKTQFIKTQGEKQAPSLAAPTRADEQGRNYVDFGKPARHTRGNLGHQSYADWTDGTNNKGGSGGFAVFGVILIIVIVIFRCL